MVLMPPSFIEELQSKLPNDQMLCLQQKLTLTPDERRHFAAEDEEGNLYYYNRNAPPCPEEAVTYAEALAWLGVDEPSYFDRLRALEKQGDRGKPGKCRYFDWRERFSPAARSPAPVRRRAGPAGSRADESRGLLIF